jgi:hypothetical protein
MTQVTMESLQASGFEGIIKEGPDVFADYSSPLPCFVRHTDAGGQCERPAVMEVYGLPFCELHGVEAKAGALAEIYDDADLDLERLDNRMAPWENPATAWWIAEAREKLHEQAIEASHAEQPAILGAYPVIAERVDVETRGYDYWTPTEDLTPVDSFSEARRLLHKLMRQAYGGGDSWLVEDLEYKREMASAQLAFALEDYERRVSSSTALTRANSAISEAHDLLEAIPKGAFRSEDRYFEARRLIAHAGEIVALEGQHIARGREPGGRREPGERVPERSPEARADPPESSGAGRSCA